MKGIKHFLILVLLLMFLIVMGVSCAPILFSLQYISEITVTDLGTLPGGRNSVAWDINEGGYIVGGSDTSTSSSGDRRAFVIDAQGIHNLGTLPVGGRSYALGISNNGYIIGAAKNYHGHLHGFITTRYGVMRDLGAFPPEDEIGSSSCAYAVNGAPLVAGNVDLAAVVWDINGTPDFPPFPPNTLINPPGPFRPAIAYDINNKGQAAGTLLSEGTGFRWSLGNLERLEKLGNGANDNAYGINSRGEVVGRALLAPPVRYHAVMWPNPSTVHDLGTLGGKDSSARDINDNGTVVGYSETASGDTHAFVWRPNMGMRSLGTLGGKNSRAYAINSDGVIVGESETATGEVHATRWDVVFKTIVVTRNKFGPAPGGD